MLNVKYEVTIYRIIVLNELKKKLYLYLQTAYTIVRDSSQILFPKKRLALYSYFHFSSLKKYYFFAFLTKRSVFCDVYCFTKIQCRA